jgi:phosphopantothenoylcysteine decarboxylase/phosphopantothenate--cysteine ligase
LGPLTLEKLAGRKVITGLFEGEDGEISHISVAREMDLLLVAPATANILGKFAAGVADDFLSTLYLSTNSPVVVAPAMNVEMWKHPATVSNLEILRQRGVVIVDPGTGYQACGEYGEGRLADPEDVCAAVYERLRPKATLGGQKILVTAGPTREDIDPVRFLSNRSSGKMGYAVAAEAVARGGEVHLVSGPTNLEPPEGCKVKRVRSAAEMAEAVLQVFQSVDIVVMAAAVGDFAPIEIQSQKVKKVDALWRLELERTVDILQELGRRKEHQFLAGFAAESENLLENARGKLRDKSLDLIVANDISGTESGFGVDRNEVVLIDAEGNQTEVPLADKKEVAQRIWDLIEDLRMIHHETS